MQAPNDIKKQQDMILINVWYQKLRYKLWYTSIRNVECCQGPACSNYYVIPVKCGKAETALWLESYNLTR
jgi:hypothetical protein